MCPCEGWFGVVSVCVDVGCGYVRVGHKFLVAYTFTHTHGQKTTQRPTQCGLARTRACTCVCIYAHAAMYICAWNMWMVYRLLLNLYRIVRIFESFLPICNMIG